MNQLQIRLLCFGTATHVHLRTLKPRRYLLCPAAEAHRVQTSRRPRFRYNGLTDCAERLLTLFQPPPPPRKRLGTHFS
jgi:hypothetical protein